MATTTKNKKTATQAADEKLQVSEERKRQVRLGFGIFFMLSGVFLCFSIISYCFTWSSDQSDLLSKTSMWQFLMHDHSPVANWGGRLGAVLSHILVYKGAGIASLVIGFGIAAIGVHMIYGSKAVPLLRYLRWTSIILLLVAPTLTYLHPYLFPDNTFSFGGALGKISIEYFNGLLGVAGTGMVLLSTILFFVFVIFALDIRPLLNRMRTHGKKLADALTPAAPVFNEDPNATAATEALTEADLKNASHMEADTNQLNYGGGNSATLISDPSANKEWNMSLVEKPAEAIVEEVEEEPEEDEEYEAYQKFAEEREAETGNQKPNPEASDLELSYVVKQVDEPAIKHGDHISIADNEPFAPEESLRSYKFPTLDLLEDRVQEAISLNKEELERNKDQIIQTLRSFSIEIKTITATVGPTVTLYEVVPSEGVRISKIRNLEDDIALNLAALGIRIIAPIPGKGTIGIEVPNANKQIVSMRALLSSEKFVNNKMSLPIALGKKIDNENYIVDLATMPHLLMAGATGQGKSVGINAILVSLLYKKHPSQLKFVMIDPKKVELSIYRKIEKHFLAKLPNENEPIITDTKKAIYTLKALCDEMDNRYELLKEAGARNIKEYNEKIVNRRIKNPEHHKYLPFIVLVIDEFADLIMTAGKEVEMPIARLAQLARAVGIHLIIATQRPSVNVITGTIKANFPARIAFKVSAKVDSRTILDVGGAEQLIGRGDMLVSHGSELLRLQCAFVDTPEVEEIVNFIGDQRGYPTAHPLPEPEMEDEEGSKNVDLKNRDKLFDDCARLVVQSQSGSTSNLQRKLNLGYNRAGRIMDQLEAAGVVGPTNGSKPRDVYFKTESELEQFLHSLE
jgi:DNA segregation ATPase FtsK/SpoIIIE, S-DNA-T family